VSRESQGGEGVRLVIINYHHKVLPTKSLEGRKSTRSGSITSFYNEWADRVWGMGGIREQQVLANERGSRTPAELIGSVQGPETRRKGGSVSFH
jgi:hypothetical protein